ncbi:MAG TPA: T9SS type A sorting domain-containing protein [Flavipsychrobacter sp.]|jgi:hypothetical protein|nr:T9SS type A sorting domain-containing protein [Flavipsychrobacter sp.]
MKRIIALLLFTAWSFAAAAQSPQIWALNPLTHDTTGLFMGGSDVPFRGNGNVYQGIYKTSDFNYLPLQGIITHFYLKLNAAIASGVLIHGYQVRIGYTTVDTVSNFMCVHNPVFPNLATVFYDTAFVIPNAIPQYGWLRVALDTPYVYDLNDGNGGFNNFVIRISQDSNTGLLPPSQTPNVCTYTGNYSISINSSSLDTVRSCGGFLLVMGFDIEPNGISDVTREKKLTVYPNPAKEALYLKNAEGQAYLITDIAGRVLLQGSMKGRSIDIGALNSGLYLLRIGTETVKFVKE